MSDLISRQAAIDALERSKDKTAKGNIGGFYNTIIQNDIDKIKGLPSAEKVGEWIEHEWAEEYDGLLISNFECSECKSWEREKTNFCPHCGARMRGEEG